MTATVIALLSIWLGIFGGLSYSLFNKNTEIYYIKRIIVGVFGSIFFIKALSKLGFTPFDILANGSISIPLLILNFTVSFLGGLVAVFVLRKVERKVGFG